MTGWVSQNKGSAVDADSIISPSCTLDVDNLHTEERRGREEGRTRETGE